MNQDIQVAPVIRQELNLSRQTVEAIYPEIEPGLTKVGYVSCLLKDDSDDLRHHTSFGFMSPNDDYNYIIGVNYDLHKNRVYALALKMLMPKELWSKVLYLELCDPRSNEKMIKWTLSLITATDWEKGVPQSFRDESN